MKRTNWISVERLESRIALAAGDVDLTFGDSGIAAVTNTTEPEDTSTIIAAGGDQFFVLGPGRVHKINASAAAITVFGNQGMVDLGFDEPEQLIILPDGKLLVSGFDTDAREVAFLQRFNADGTPDSTFGQQSVVDVDAINPNAAQLSIAAQSDGKIILHVSEPFGQDSVIRLNTNGTVDNTFTPFSFDDNSSPVPLLV